LSNGTKASPAMELKTSQEAEPSRHLLSKKERDGVVVVDNVSRWATACVEVLKVEVVSVSVVTVVVEVLDVVVVVAATAQSDDPVHVLKSFDGAKMAAPPKEHRLSGSDVSPCPK